MKLKFWRIFMIFLFLHSLDFGITYWGVFIRDYDEGNPIIKNIIINFGAVGFITFFILSVILIYFIIKFGYYYYKKQYETNTKTYLIKSVIFSSFIFALTIKSLIVIEWMNVFLESL